MKIFEHPVYPVSLGSWRVSVKFRCAVWLPKPNTVNANNFEIKLNIISKGQNYVQFSGLVDEDAN
ncbi:hypothetical protein, partial [Escherichia coli]|uniref:hypothetical protein n=1 Tax=Escherichia coli TaxID=562 RepID=UPI00200BFBE5